MIGRTKVAIQTRRRPGTSWTMGKLRAETLVEWTVSENGWLQIDSNRWIPAQAVRVIGELPPITPGPFLDGDIRMVRFHSEMPEGDQNRCSFGIVRVYAHPKADKPHSIFPSKPYMDSIQWINTARAFSWMFEHNDNKFFGANYDDGSGYRIPAQGVFMGNLVRVLKEENGFSQLEGIIGSIPAGMTYLTNPELIHICWCVGKFGQTIPPPCGAAYMPVVNPSGMRGANVGGEIQTEIWIENKWLRKISA